MPATYNCTTCNEGFGSKSERDNHVRIECELSVKLTDPVGNIQTIERTEGRFECPNCSVQYTRGNHLKSHWLHCKTKNMIQGTIHLSNETNICSKSG